MADNLWAGEHAQHEWRLISGGYEATVMAIGATVRTLTFHGRDLVVPFGAAELRPFYRGALIAPWPNRIADGRYSLGGQQFQLPLNEVDRGHALHGLAHWIRWEAVLVQADLLLLEHELVPQDGYPFAVRLRVEYRVGPAGLTTRLTAKNVGSSPAPYGCCPHPYLVAGSGELNSWQLELPAARRLEVDERLLPLKLAAVDSVDCDFRAPATIGEREIDHAFTDLAPVEGRTTVSVRDLDKGTGVSLSWGPWAGWVQIHTADRPESEYNRVGLAVEPMNCPPDAFNSDIDAVLLPAGATHQAEWTISALD